VVEAQADVQKVHGLNSGGCIISTNYQLFFQDIWHNLSYILEIKQVKPSFTTEKIVSFCPHGDLDC
jgi:hypothetical protein